MQYEDTREFAVALDRADPLARFRQQFNFPRERDGRAPVYFCGNSLGLQPKLAVDYVQQELQNWRDYAVDGHFHSERPWITYHQLATDGFASLAGAEPGEVVAMNTLTVNLHLLMASFYRPDAIRRKIVIEAGAFPSDQYAAASQIRLHGYDPETDLLEWHPRDGETSLRTEDLAALLDREGDSVALLLLPGVQYFTGQVLDMAAICELGRQHGCKVGLDLAHAIGNVAAVTQRLGARFRLLVHLQVPECRTRCDRRRIRASATPLAGRLPARLVGQQTKLAFQDGPEFRAGGRRRGLADEQSADTLVGAGRRITANVHGRRL